MCQPRCLNSSTECKLKYCCVCCGQPIESLFKQYTSSVLKIMKCNSCGEVADPYIECETIIVIFDLVLLQRTAYRHVLYNTEFQIRWKLIVVLLLLESYILSKEQQKLDPENIHDLSSEQFFYSCFLLTIIDKFLLFAMLRVLCLGFHAEHNAKRGQLHCVSNIVKSITLASITRFFLLPIVIYHSNTTEPGIRLHEALVSVYFMIALTKIYSILVSRPQWLAACLVALALTVKMIVFDETRRLIDL